MNDSLVALAKLLMPGDPSLAEEVELALNDPAEYAVQFAQLLDDRGLTETEPDLSWFALIDGLGMQGRMIEVDWKESAMDVIESINTLFEAISVPAPEWHWVELKSWEETLPAEFLKAVNDHLVKSGWLIIYFEIDSDSFPIALIPASQFIEIEKLAQKAGYSILVNTTGK